LSARTHHRIHDRHDLISTNSIAALWVHRAQNCSACAKNTLILYIAHARAELRLH
jgi:hypothetical protein